MTMNVKHINPSNNEEINEKEINRLVLSMIQWMSSYDPMDE